MNNLSHRLHQTQNRFTSLSSTSLIFTWWINEFVLYAAASLYPLYSYIINTIMERQNLAQGTWSFCKNNFRRTFTVEPQEKIFYSRPMHKWEDNIKTFLRELVFCRKKWIAPTDTGNGQLCYFVNIGTKPWILKYMELIAWCSNCNAPGRLLCKELSA
jgi:hypothetical protein